MRTFGNIALVVALAAVFTGGIAFFVIARQDDSRTGQRIGIATVLVALLGFAWLFAGHWL